jgi:hypothetical protein
MCDGNLAMANRFVDMSENDMNELHDWEMFKVLYPFGQVGIVKSILIFITSE